MLPGISDLLELLVDGDLLQIGLRIGAGLEGEEEHLFCAIATADARHFDDLKRRQFIDFGRIQAVADTFPSDSVEEGSWPAEGPRGNVSSTSFFMRAFASASAFSASSCVMPVTANMIAARIGA